MTSLKHHDLGQAETIPAAAGSILNTTWVAIAQGFTETSRVGRKITVEHIEILGRYHLISNSTPDPEPDRVRFIVFVDHQANGGVPTVAQMYEPQTIDGHSNVYETDRFTVLYDEITDINHEAGGATRWGGEFSSFHLNLLDLGIPIEYSGVGGSLSELRSNNISVLAFTERGVAKVSYNARIWFDDSPA